MRTSNPALSDSAFQQAVGPYDSAAAGSETMTVQGAATKTVILLGILLVPAIYTWNQFFQGQTELMPWFMWGGVGVGAVLALVTIFKPTASPYTAPLYAAAEGCFLGALSAVFEAQYPGIVIQAVMLTFGTLFSLLMVYKSGLIKVTQNFRLGIAAATGGIALIYLVSIGANLFGTSVPYIHESGLIGIGFSLFVVVIAALNLVLDFDFIERGEAAGAPRYMEWYAAFGLMVTLIWLYIEFLRLLSKLRR